MCNCSVEVFERGLKTGMVHHLTRFAVGYLTHLIGQAEARKAKSKGKLERKEERKKAAAVARAEEVAS